MVQDYASSDAGATRAVAYARMSRTIQDQSIQHQLDSIHAYAAANNMAIVQTFVDEGISGLSLTKRPGLQALLARATGPAPGFAVIIVHDVSRWGRFQDTDEGAFYEYLCRRAGVEVVYCAEPFAGAASPMDALMKVMKRIMAAEYSRELGEKVFRAQCRFTSMGYKQGGLPGFGMQRVPVGTDGQKKAPLLRGERKPMPTDRVGLALGSATDVMTVRRIYALYNEVGWSDSRIAAALRADSGSTHMGKPWSANNVRRILTNSRYCGEIVFNQTTRRLGGRVVANAPHLWVRCVSALEPMVDRAQYELAQRIRADRAQGPARKAVLEHIRAVYREHGTINEQLCKKAGLPGRIRISKLFGGYVEAYEAAGLPALKTESGALGNRSMRAVVDCMLRDVHAVAQRAGATVSTTEVWNVLLLNGGLRLKVSVASSRLYSDGGRRLKKRS